jgi:hypothetical protein
MQVSTAATTSSHGHLPIQQLQQANAALSKRANSEDAASGVSYKRKRTSRACIVCSRKKIKCSGILPCAPCVAMGEDCSFAGAARTTTTRGDSLEARVKLQEARIHRLEALLVAQGATLDPLPEEDQLETKRAPRRLSSGKMGFDKLLAGPDIELGAMEHSSPSEKAALLRPDARGNLRCGRLSFAEAPGRADPLSVVCRYIGAASTTSILIELDRIQGEALPGSNTPSRMSWLTAPLGLSIAQALPPPAGVELPDRDLADKLVEVFFEQLQPL